MAGKNANVDDAGDPDVLDGTEGTESGEGTTDKPGKTTKKNPIDGVDADADTIKSAVSLYKALQDPESGMEIIETLAKRAGILDRSGSPKATEQVTEKKLDSISKKFLREHLGKDYEQFADKVGPAFDAIIQHYLKEKFGEAEALTTQDSWEKSVDTFMGDYVLTPEIESKMKELLEDSPPNLRKRGFDAQKYLTRLYKSAVEELGETPKPKKAPSRKSESDDIPDFVVRDAPKNVSLDDAIEAAMKGIRFRRRD